MVRNARENAIWIFLFSFRHLLYKKVTEWFAADLGQPSFLFRIFLSSSHPFFKGFAPFFIIDRKGNLDEVVLLLGSPSVLCFRFSPDDKREKRAPFNTTWFLPFLPFYFSHKEKIQWIWGSSFFLGFRFGPFQPPLDCTFGQPLLVKDGILFLCTSSWD